MANGDTTELNRKNGDVFRVNFKVISLIIGAILGIVALFGSWVSMPLRVEAQEKRIGIMEDQLKKNTELLIRIDTRVEHLYRGTQSVKP